MSLEVLLRQHAELKLSIEAKDLEIKNLKKELDTINEAVFNKLDEEGLASCKVPGLGNFISGDQDYYSVTAESKDKTMAAFKEEFPELVKETINANTLSAFMREAKKTEAEDGTTQFDELPDAIKEGVSCYNKRTLQWRKG